MRALALLSGVLLLAGCSEYFPSRAVDSGINSSITTCQSETNALRIHDAKIDAARSSGSMGFKVQLASRGYSTYHCTSRPNGQIACVRPESGVSIPSSNEVNRLLRERSRIEARVARACKV